MLASGHILGTEVGSTAPAFLAVLAVHVIAGLTAVITGAIAALARKGSPRHVRAGRWYYRAISVVFATAAILAVMHWRQDYHLFIIGAVAFTAATAGVQHRRRHRPGDTGHIAGMGTAYVAADTHCKLGDLLSAIGQDRTAHEHWRAAQAIFEEIGDPRAHELRRRREN